MIVKIYKVLVKMVVYHYYMPYQSISMWPVARKNTRSVISRWDSAWNDYLQLTQQGSEDKTTNHKRELYGLEQEFALIFHWAR